jgi:hypothetical protein
VNCVTIHLESIRKGEDSASILDKSSLRKFSDYRFVHVLHFLLHCLGIVRNFSLLFHREKLFLNTVELHVKNTMTLHGSGHVDRFVTKTSKEGIYEGVELCCLNSTARSSIQAEKENLIHHVVMYLEGQVFNKKDVEWFITVFDTFAWPAGSTLENYGVCKITVTYYFQKQLSLSNTYDKYVQALHNEWYEFSVLENGKKLSKLHLTLANKERFPVVRRFLLILSVLPVSAVCHERVFNLIL